MINGHKQYNHINEHIDKKTQGESQMNKKRTIVLSVLMILVMIGMMLIPAAIGESTDPFTITVSSGQSTSITASTDTSFDGALPGATIEIADSIDLTNVGNEVATVNAKFTTFRSTTYGLNGTTSVIPGTSFSMSGVIADSYIALAATDSDTLITGSNIAADAVADVWKVQLILPAGTTAEAYSGTVELTFADVA